MEWLTCKENSRHFFKNGYVKGSWDHSGEKNGKAILSEHDVEDIRRRFTGKWGEKAQFAREFGVSHGCICNILADRSWVGRWLD